MCGRVLSHDRFRLGQERRGILCSAAGIQKSGQQYLCVSKDENLDLFFRIYNDNMKETGICIVVLDKRAVQLLFENMESYNNSVWAVTDSQGALIAGGGRKRLWKPWGKWKPAIWGKPLLDGVSALCGTQDCGFGIRTAVAVGIGNIFNILRPTLFTFLAVLVLALFLVRAMVFGISYRFTKPLKEVAEGIAAFGQEIWIPEWEIFPFRSSMTSV